jgi:hypothetical protein
VRIRHTQGLIAVEGHASLRTPQSHREHPAEGDSSRKAIKERGETRAMQPSKPAPSAGRRTPGSVHTARSRALHHGRDSLVTVWSIRGARARHRWKCMLRMTLLVFDFQSVKGHTRAVQERFL